MSEIRRIIRGGVVTVEATEDTPELILNPHTSTINIFGASFPEDAVDFYSYVIKWIKENKENLNKKLTCSFDYTILSSASNKMVFEIILKMEDLSKEGFDVKVVWSYPSYDEDMYDEGKTFKDTVKIPFDIVMKESF